MTDLFAEIRVRNYERVCTIKLKLYFSSRHVNQLVRGHLLSTYVRKIFRKANISNALVRTRTCIRGLKMLVFSKKFAYVLNG